MEKNIKRKKRAIEEKKPQRKRVVATIQDATWHIIDMYLVGFENLGMQPEDEELNRMIAQLQQYVAQKITLPYDGEVIDEYLTVLQEINE
ncbi:MAG: hypothetical protein K2L51_01825 [Clostridiales bacterium]|nr:hypothetical protein [Clostridiales bacterium]